MDTIKFEVIKQYAPEFISTIAETAWQTVFDWMQTNHVPEEVIRLADNSILLERFSNKAEYGKMSDVDLKEFTENLPEVTEFIARLGGTFIGPATVSIPRIGAGHICDNAH